jgi:hypothetical protein
MTKLLEKALETVRQLPPAEQDEIARTMLSLAGDEEPEDIDPAHLPAILEGWRRYAGVNSQPRPKSNLHSAASIHEASVLAPCGAGPDGNRRLQSARRQACACGDLFGAQ